jgi:hypothetical protein
VPDGTSGTVFDTARISEIAVPRGLAAPAGGSVPMTVPAATPASNRVTSGPRVNPATSSLFCASSVC